jgi:transcriptional regulator GlxA family with amidase domain
MAIRLTRGKKRIHILVLEDCTPLVPVGFADLLRKTVMLVTPMVGGDGPQPLEVTLVSCGSSRAVTAAGGLRLHCDARLEEVRQSDLVLVPPLDPDVLQHLELNRAAVPWLRRMYERGADVASACTGTFLLAEAGLLSGRAATTHWAFQELLRARYPLVRIEPQAIVVDQGRVCTAGGATSFLNLSLFVIERLFGPPTAHAASKMFLVDLNKSPQSAYAMFSTQKTHGDEQILRAQDLIEQELRSCPSVEQLARRTAMSRRTFIRRFKHATGNSPLDYILRVRVEAAKRALESSSQSISEVANAVGYTDVVAFRKVFVRLTGLTPVDYRARYGPASTPSFVGAANRTARKRAAG